MIVLPSKRALLLKLRDPSRITTVIPAAKVVRYKGEHLVAVPHRVDEVRVLRNLGIHAPSPMRFYYDWPGRFSPFKAQRDTGEFLTLHGNAFVLNDLGTGKSLSALWAYDYLRRTGVLNKVLVVSSLSTLERVWGDEVFYNFPHLTFSILHGTAARRIQLLNDRGIDVYIINHDGVKTSGFAEAIAPRADIDLVIVDEIAQAARNATTARWKALNRICNKQAPRRVWGMTGKPTPNAPTDAWAQCRLVNPSTVPPYFNRFKDAVMVQRGPFTWLPRPNAMDTVYDAMQPAIRFTRDQCVDLPPCIYQARQADLSKEQVDAYRDMMNHLRSQVEGGEITAFNEATKIGKLLQIACGVAYGPTGDEVTIPSESRLNILREIIDESEAKVIVFVPFVSAVQHVAEFVAKTHSVEIIYGDIKKSERDRIFGAFQKDKDPHVIVAQPAAMAHGLTLTRANTIVWYSAITSNEIYEQANGRIVRPGQRLTQFIIHIEGSPVERRLYSRLKQKQDLQGLLLEMVKLTDHSLNST